MKLPALVCAFLSVVSLTVAKSPARAPFSLKIVPTESQRQEGERTLFRGDRFFVVLTNISAVPQRIFEDWSSVGYCAISFRAITQGGKTVPIKRRELGASTRNYPATFRIPPGGHYVFVFELDEKEWPDLPKTQEFPSHPVTLTAIFTEPCDSPGIERDVLVDNAEKHGVWIGRVESKPERFIIDLP